MTYSIQGLDPAPFARFFAADPQSLRSSLAERVTAASDSGYPCRVSLSDARTGDQLLLVNHVSNDVARPFRIAHAIYVRESAERAAPLHDAVPEMLDRRTLGLRAFDRDGMLRSGALAVPGTADEAIRALFGDPEIAYIHAHNAAYGCFLAAVERSDD
jgi:hypothetical protein